MANGTQKVARHQCPHGYFLGRDCTVCLDDEEQRALREVKTYEDVLKALGWEAVE